MPVVHSGFVGLDEPAGAPADPVAMQERSARGSGGQARITPPPSRSSRQAVVSECERGVEVGGLLKSLDCRWVLAFAESTFTGEICLERRKRARGDGGEARKAATGDLDPARNELTCEGVHQLKEAPGGTFHCREHRSLLALANGVETGIDA
jgi:hypothetical protein